MMGGKMSGMSWGIGVVGLLIPIVLAMAARWIGAHSL